MKKLILTILVSLTVLTAVHAEPTTEYRYVVTLELKQVHYSLDLWKHAKDAANKTTLQIPVDKQFFDEVSIGSRLNDEWRVGSMILNGSFGKWRVTVTDKKVVQIH